MTALIAAVSVALIGGPVMWFLHRFDRRNSSQHAHNSQTLDRIDAKLDHHDAKLDRHDAKLDAVAARLDDHISDKKGHR